MNTPPDRAGIALRELGVITAIVDDIPALDDDHGVLQYGSFYTEEVDGEELVDWVTRLIEGGPVDDLLCRECTAG